MGKYFKVFVVCLMTALSLSSCSSTSSQEKLSLRENTLEVRKDYNSYLALRYLTYSRALDELGRGRDSVYFAKKGLNAANNVNTFPESPEDWRLDDTAFLEASLGYDRLVSVILEENKEVIPEQLASLQFFYDCWVEKESGDYDLTGMGKCKAQFYSLLEEVEGFTSAITQLKQEKLQKQKNLLDQKRLLSLSDKEDGKFDIYFDFDCYKLNEKGIKEIVKILDYIDSLDGQFIVELEGHTDRVGKKLYNEALARKRALSVKSKLVANGVPNSNIKMKALGENAPRIITKNNVQNQNNRRVTIYVRKEDSLISTVPLPIE